MKSIFILSFLTVLFIYNVHANEAVDQLTRMNNNSHVFIENKGQWSEEVRYLAKAKGMNAWITDKGIVYDFFRIESEESNYKDALFVDEGHPDFDRHLPGHDLENTKRISQVVRMSFDGADIENVSGNIQQTGYHNYFIGNDKSKWASNVRLFGEVNMDNVYEGIDAKLYYDGGSVRYDLIAAPGADISQIKMKFTGQDNLSVNDNGELLIHTRLGEVEHRKIYAYQTDKDVQHLGSVGHLLSLAFN